MFALRLRYAYAWLLLWGLLYNTAGVVVSTEKPRICAAMLSFNRPHYLIPSVRAIVGYMNFAEPHIPWTLQILDNGSGPEVLAQIAQQLAPLRHTGLMRLFHLQQNVGLSRGFNLLFLRCVLQLVHRMCSVWKMIGKHVPTGQETSLSCKQPCSCWKDMIRFWKCG